MRSGSRLTGGEEDHHEDTKDTKKSKMRSARSLRALRGTVSVPIVFTSCSSCLRGEYSPIHQPDGTLENGQELGFEAEYLLHQADVVDALVPEV